MLFFVYFLIMLSFFDMFAQLPIMSTYAQSLGASISFIGFIVGAYSFSNLFSNVFSGYLVDRNGPKSILGLGFLINGLILLSYSIVSNPIQLFTIRLLHGITAGFLTPAAFTYVSILNKKKQSGKTMAFAGAAVGIAAIFGPAFGGIVSNISGAPLVFQIIGTLMVISGVLIFIFLKPLQKNESSVTEKHKYTTYLPLLKNIGLISAYLGAFTLMFSQGILAYMLPLKVEFLNLGSNISGTLLSVFGVIAILFFLLPSNRIFDRFKNDILMAFGMLIIAIALVVLSITSNLTIMYVSMAIYGSGFALLFPSISALIAKNTHPDERGKAYGLFYGFFSLGSVAGSYITGAFNMTSTEAFLTAALVLSVTGVTLLSIIKKMATNHQKNIEMLK